MSIALFFIGRVSLLRALFYIVAQLLGATVGSALLFAIVPMDKRGNMGQTLPSPELDDGQAFVVEVILTFVLAFTVCACIDEGRIQHIQRTSIPLTIGMAVIVTNLMGIPYSGASLNPARTFGPAVVGGTWTSHWIYWLGPISGALSAALLYTIIFSAKVHPEQLHHNMTLEDEPSSQHPAMHQRRMLGGSTAVVEVDSHSKPINADESA